MSAPYETFPFDPPHREPPVNLLYDAGQSPANPFVALQPAASAPVHYATQQPVAYRQVRAPYYDKAESNLNVSTKLAFTALALGLAAAMITVANEGDGTCRDNTTCAQVANDLGYPELLPLQLNQIENFTTPSHSSELILNESHTRLDLSTVHKMFDYYDRNAASLAPRHVALFLTAGTHAKPTDISLTSHRQPATKHVVVSLDSVKQYPESVRQLDPFDPPAGITTYDDTDTISLVTPPTEEAADGTPLTAQDVLFTESCQAMITVEDRRKSAIASQLGQETVCNSVGFAFENATRNVPYANYVQYVRESNSQIPYVPYNGADFLLRLYAMTAHQYEQVQTALL